jgi:hypothetical protein
MAAGWCRQGADPDSLPNSLQCRVSIEDFRSLFDRKLSPCRRKLAASRHRLDAPVDDDEVDVDF